MLGRSCILNYMNNNQHDVLFIFSLLSYRASTCFGRISSPSWEGIIYLCGKWYLLHCWGDCHRAWPCPMTVSDHTCRILGLLDPDAKINSIFRNVGKCLPLKTMLKSYKARILEQVFTKAFYGDSIAINGYSVSVLATCHYCTKIICTAWNVRLFLLAF
jgi:hypothetical protein